jgi:hypothetical protein
MAFVSPSEDFLNGYGTELFPAFFCQLFDILDRRLDLLLPLIGIGNEAGDWPAMPGDDDRLATLDRIEQFRQMGLCLGSRDFAERRAVPSECGRVFGELTGTARFHGGQTLTN